MRKLARSSRHILYPRRWGKAARRLVASGLLLSACASLTAAFARAEVQSQPPWAYNYRSDARDRVEFMATTPAVEDGDVWLLLACGTDRTFRVSLLRPSGFPFHPGGRLHLALRLDDAPPMASPAVLVQRGLITADPNATSHLFAVITRGEVLSVTISEAPGAPQDYSFHFQPNDRALHDIGVHCFNIGA
jgi:hypothetical protein